MLVSANALWAATIILLNKPKPAMNAVQDEFNNLRLWITAVVSVVGLFTGFVAPTLFVPSQSTDAHRPEHVYNRFQAAWHKADGAAIMACLTPARQRELVYEMAFGYTMRNTAGLEPFLDKTKARQWMAIHGPPTSNSQHREYLFVIMKDPGAFLSAALKKRGSGGDGDEPLRNLLVKDNRAHGVVTRHVIGLERKGGKDVATATPNDRRVYFRRINGKWYLDVSDMTTESTPGDK
jgi:hypothetical protein